MPVTPNFLERLVLLRLNRGPAPILDLFGAAGFKAVTLALDIELFNTLAEANQPLSAKGLADRLDAHPRGIGTLCNFLATQGYLEATAGKYSLSGMTETWLLSDAERNMGPWFTFWDDLVFPFWERELETAIRDGEPSQSIYEWFDEEPARWEIAQDGFRATANLIVDDVVDAVTVPAGRTRLIDIGGGHGLYAMELCRQYPELSATIFDSPAAIDAIKDDVPAALTGRLSTRAGDYWTDDFGEDYDLALLFNVVHAHDPAENTTLFERVAEALAPEGRIVVLDQWEGSARTPVSRTGLGFVALTYLTTLGAAVYEYDEVASWLRAAGFADITRTGVGPLSGQAIVEATKA